MSWNDQVSAGKSRGLASGVICALQAPLLTSLMPHGPNHRIAESFFLVESSSAVPGTYNITGNYDTLVIHNSDSLPQVSQHVTSDIVTHDCDLWDGEYYITLLSGHFSYLENNAKVLASFRSIPLEAIQLSNFLLFWEQVLLCGTCSKLYLQ